MTAQYYVTVASGVITGTGYTPDGTLPPGAIVCTQSQAEAAGPWSSIVSGALVVGTMPPVPLKGAAQTALAKSDITILRCVEHGVAVPAEWVNYRGELRAIAAGASSPTALPTVPAFPAGT